MFGLKFRAALTASALCAALLGAASSHAGLFDDHEARRAILDLQSRLDALESQLSAAPRALLEQSNRLEQQPQQRTVDGIQGTAQPGEAEAFDTALQPFRKGDFKRAEALFKNFIAQYPASPYQPTAQYWLGNALYAQREYKSAIAILERV